MARRRLLSTHRLSRPRRSRTRRASTSPGVDAIRLAGVSTSFGPVRAGDNLDPLTIAPGEVVAFLGPNGPGKTSILDMVLGLSRPDTGSAQVFGLPRSRPSATAWSPR